MREEMIFTPVLIKADKAVYYLPEGGIAIKKTDYEKVKQIYPLVGKKVLYKGSEFIMNDSKDDIFLEKEIPVRFLIIKSYFNKVINSFRSIAPYLILKSVKDDADLVEVLLVDDISNPNIVVKDAFTTNEIIKYGQPNKIVDMVIKYYTKCKELNKGWNRPKLPVDNLE